MHISKDKRKGMMGTLLLALTVLVFTMYGGVDASADTGIWLENGFIGLYMQAWGSDDFEFPVGSNNLYSSGGQRFAVRYNGVFKWSKGAGTIPGYYPVLATIDDIHYLANTPEMMVTESKMGDDTVEVDTTVTMLAGTKWVGIEYTIRNISANSIDLQFYEGDDFDVDHGSYTNDSGKYDSVLKLLMEWDYDGFPYVGVAAVTEPSNHDISDYYDMWGRIIADNLINRDSYVGDPGVAFEWELGQLLPGESVKVFKVLGAGESEADLQAEIDNGIGWFISFPVAIDIKPGSDPNAINITSNGVVPIAILSLDGFDARSVDPATVTVSGASPVRSAAEDVNGDGTMDLVLHFRTQDLTIPEDATALSLIGQTYDGDWVGGSDSVKVVTGAKNKGQHNHKLQAGLYNVGISDCDVTAISGNIIAISIDEGEENADYNNDGDTNDKVLGYYDIQKQKLTNTGISIGQAVTIDGDLIAFELVHGDSWYNRTLAYYSISRNRLFDTGEKTSGFGNSTSGTTRGISDGIIAYTDTAHEICYYDTRTETSHCTGNVGGNPSIDGAIIAFISGTNWWSGEIFYYDMQTGDTHDTGISGREPILDDNIIVFKTTQGIGYYDISTGEYADTPLVKGYSASISDGLISAFVNESYWGDLNGDGDTNDFAMVMVYDIRTGQLINTGVQGCCGTDISNGVIVFDKYEGQDNPGTDYNGDGDTNDCVQHYLVLDLKRTGNGRLVR